MITLAFTRYNESDKLVLDTLNSALKNKGIQILYFEQEPSQKVKAFCKKHKTITYKEIKKEPISVIRNKAIKINKNEILALTDCDVILAKNWSEEILKCFADEKVAVVSSKIIPKLHKKPPILYKSAILKEQYSIQERGEENKEITKAIGANIVFHTKRAKEELYFKEDMGRKNGKLLGGEEMDLCERIRKKGYKIMYCGKTHIYHQITKERLTNKWILKRCYYAGMSRRQRGGLPDPNSKKRNIWDFIFFPIFIVPFIAGYLQK